MPRLARIHAPGAVHHIIARFVNRELRVNEDAERAEYLRRLDRAIARTDWLLLSYGLMGNHIHLAALAGNAPSSRFTQSVHSGFATWLNRRQMRLGHLFAGRPRSFPVADDVVPALIAYIHNNPIRAGVVVDPASSTWTSHRAYCGLAPAIPSLNVDAGLALSGFGREGRAAFHNFVVERSTLPRQPMLSGEPSSTMRRAVRDALGPAAEITEPVLADERLVHSIRARIGAPLRVPCPVSASRVVARAAIAAGIPVAAVAGRDRSRPTVRARRLALVMWQELGRAQIEMAALLGISESAASRLLHRDPDAVAKLRPVARELCSELAEAATGRAGAVG
jgi:REP element-mobilizing transposase RayT